MSSFGGVGQTSPRRGALAGGLGRLAQTGHDLAGGLGRTSPRRGALAGGVRSNNGETSFLCGLLPSQCAVCQVASVHELTDRLAKVRGGRREGVGLLAFAKEHAAALIVNMRDPPGHFLQKSGQVVGWPLNNFMPSLDLRLGHQPRRYPQKVARWPSGDSSVIGQCPGAGRPRA
jgi:hypothetical protein